MISTLRLSVVVVVLALGCGTLRAEETLADVEKQIIEKWSKIQSLSAETKMDGKRVFPVGTSETDSSGTYFHKKVDGKSLFRQVVTSHQVMRMENQPETVTDQTLTMVADGTYIYSLSETATVRQGSKSHQQGTSISVGGAELIEYMRDDAKLQLLPDGVIDGQAVWVIDAAQNRGGGRYKTRYYISKEHGMFLRRVSLTVDGTDEVPSTTLSLTNVKIGVDIPDDQFVLEFPPGVEINDRTQPVKP